jgi:putative alpha-1,2-mannosidase
MRARAALLACLLALVAAPTARAADPATFVDPTIGTWAPGFVFPGADVPFGMVQNSPDTLDPTGSLTYSGYNAHEPAIRDFSLVHLSGPGVAKAGNLPFMPWVGPVAPPTDPKQYASPYSHAGEHAEAGYYSVQLANGTAVELTAATHAAMQRYRFPPAGDAYLIVDAARDNSGLHQGGFTVDPADPHEISGWATDRYPVHFVARFSEPVVAHGTTWVRFAPGSTVTMRVGISYVDADGARRNLDAEAPADLSFETMVRDAHTAWSRELSKARVGGGTVADKRAYYTALYHALLHPNVFTDVDGRYLGFDGQPHVADGRTQYANFSLWDTYKAQNQLLALIEPDRYADMLRSLLADAREGGHLPRWAEANYDPAHMSGDPAIPTIADGVCRGLIGGAEADELYADSVGLRDRRPDDFKALGYEALDRHDSGAGTTLEFGGADFALALLADRLGHPDDAQRWLADSLAYRKLLDPDTKWIRPRYSDGSWYPNFDPAHDETGFQEGNSWQYSWLAPHDARGLFDRMGGDPAAVDRLDHLFAATAEVQNRLTLFGVAYRFDQWAPGNEHDLGAPYLYAFAGQPWKTQAELRAAQALYRPTIDGLPGNDDLGSLSAWYVWTALGFGPFTPGAPLYMVGAPQFPHATITLGGHGRFVVDAPGASLAGKYVQAATLDGAPLDQAWFGADAVRPHGRLHLEMGVQPNTGWGVAARPPSASDSPLSAFGCHA